MAQRGAENYKRAIRTLIAATNDSVHEVRTQLQNRKGNNRYLFFPPPLCFFVLFFLFSLLFFPSLPSGGFFPSYYYCLPHRDSFLLVSVFSFRIAFLLLFLLLQSINESILLRPIVCHQSSFGVSQSYSLHHPTR